MNNPGISVIICTYNGLNKLLSTISHLINQKNLIGIDWEILIIDNASTDGTFNWLTELIDKNNYQNLIKLHQQPIPGKLAALKMGVYKANFDYLLICDDDNWLDENYLHRVYQIFKNEPKIGVIGGNGQPATQEVPKWIKPYLHNYAAAPQWSKSADITNQIGSVYGAGMGIRKRIYANVFSDDWILNLSAFREKNNLMSGEDTEICYIARFLGYSIYYDEDLTFKHTIPIDKLNPEYYLRLVHLFGFGHSVLIPYQEIFYDNLITNQNKFPQNIIVELYRLIRYDISAFLLNKNLENRRKLTYRWGFIKGLILNFNKILKLKKFLKSKENASPSSHI
ncbi:glycosyltransferase family 2 protein [Pedobacter chinensis]|uniref:Glycosyltransferase family 2 protein n=1 Tax=Pedobacter chinensis TaxID=2282421 RepID=A0A369PU89_9SPHI|nr:glycosyltransferase family 2 protein [Pedobacter chinensis]RDC56221.1 glycosyltransferase family 2 protein [Pedobacter chinensis]